MIKISRCLLVFFFALNVLVVSYGLSEEIDADTLQGLTQEAFVTTNDFENLKLTIDRIKSNAESCADSIVDLQLGLSDLSDDERFVREKDLQRIINDYSKISSELISISSVEGPGDRAQTLYALQSDLEVLEAELNALQTYVQTYLGHLTTGDKKWYFLDSGFLAGTNHSFTANAAISQYVLLVGQTFRTRIDSVITQIKIRLPIGMPLSPDRVFVSPYNSTLSTNTFINATSVETNEAPVYTYNFPNYHTYALTPYVFGLRGTGTNPIGAYCCTNEYIDDFGYLCIGNFTRANPTQYAMSLQYQYDLCFDMVFQSDTNMVVSSDGIELNNGANIRINGSRVTTVSELNTKIAQTTQSLHYAISNHVFGTSSIANNSITADKLASNAVITVKISDEAVTTRKIADQAITESKISTNAVTTAKIKNGAITGEKIANDAITSTKISSNAVTTVKIANNAITCDKIIDSAVTSNKIVNNAVNSDKIAGNSITADKVANNAITSHKINNGAVTADKIYNGAVTADKINNGAVTAAKISDGAVNSYKIADSSITTAKISNGAVNSDKLASNSVSANKITAGAISTEKLADNAVSSAKIAGGAITSGKIADNSVTSGKIDTSAVTSEKIAMGAITSNKIASNSVTSDKIEANAISSSKIISNAITTDKINDNAVTTSKIADDSIIQSHISNDLRDNLVMTRGGTVTGCLEVAHMKFNAEADWLIGQTNICSDIVLLNEDARIRNNAGQLKLSASQGEAISAESFLSFDSGAQAGIVMINNGSKEAFILCENITSEAIIMLTPRQMVTNLWWSVQPLSDDSKIKITIDKEWPIDLFFNYFIIRK